MNSVQSVRFLQVLKHTLTKSGIDSAEEQQRFKDDPSKMLQHAKEIENKLNRGFHGFYHGSEAQRQTISFLHRTMKQKIRDPELLKCTVPFCFQSNVESIINLMIGLTPDFAPGCRRITPGDPFITAIQKPNAEVVFKSVTRLTRDGVVDTEGVERKFDAVVCATGMLPPVPHSKPFRGRWRLTTLIEKDSTLTSPHRSRCTAGIALALVKSLPRSKTTTWAIPCRASQTCFVEVDRTGLPPTVL